MQQHTEPLQNLLDAITVFDQECQEVEYTDVGQAWDLLHRIRTTIEQILAEVSPPSDA